MQEEKIKIDEYRKENNKKVSQLYRELEKLQVMLERKVGVEQFNERIESKADKQMVLNAVMNKVSKIEVEQVL